MTLSAIELGPDLLDPSILKKNKKTPAQTPEQRYRQYQDTIDDWYAKHHHENWTKADITEHLLDFTPEEREAFFKLFIISKEEVTKEAEASTTTVASQQSNDLQHAESQAEPETNTEAPNSEDSPPPVTEASTPTTEDTAPAAEDTPAAEDAPAAEETPAAEPEPKAEFPEPAVPATAKPLETVTLDPPVTVKKLLVLIDSETKPIKTTKKPRISTLKPRISTIKPLVSTLATTTVVNKMGSSQSAPKVLPGGQLNQDLSSGWRFLDVHLPSAFGTAFICVMVVIMVAVVLRCCLRNWLSYRRVRHQREVELSLRELRRSNNENQLSSLIGNQNPGGPIQPIIRSQPRVALPLDVV